MKRYWSVRPFLVAVLVVSSLFVTFMTISSASGPALARTGAPDELNCTSCHSGTAVTSGTHFNNLKIATSMTNGEYKPGNTYTITVSYSETGRSKFGFETTVLKASDSTQAGDLVVTNATTTAKGTASVNSQTRQYIHHKSNGTSGSGKISWSFEWDAPSTNVGNVVFYVAVASTNNNNGTSGDRTIVKSFTFKPQSTDPVADFTVSRFQACVGDTITFNGSRSKNSTGYAWTLNGTTPKNPTSQIVKAVWQKAGTYNIKLVTSKGTVNSKPVFKTITILELPDNAVTQQGNSPFCSGDSISLKAEDGVSWLWSNGASTQELYITITDTYQVAITGSNGCKSLSTDLSIEVKAPLAAPIVKCAQSTTESITISWATDPLVTDYEVSLDEGKTWNPTDKKGEQVLEGLTYNTEKVFWVRGSEDGPCAYSLVGKQTCKSAPCFKIEFDVTGDEACKNGTGLLKLDNLSLERFGISYNDGPVVSDTFYEFNPSNYAAGSHKVKASFRDSSAPSCPAFDTNITFTIHPLPIPSVHTKWEIADGTNKICELSSPKELIGNTADLNEPEPYVKRIWSGPGVVRQGGNYTFDPIVSGLGGPFQLTFTVTNTYGCVNEVRDAITVDGAKGVEISADTDNGYANFSQNIQSAGGWLWDFGDGETSTDENPTHIYTADGTYWVTLTTNDPKSACPEVADSISVDILGSSTMDSHDEMAFFPNPFTGQLSVYTGHSATDGLTVNIYNQMGQLAYQSSFEYPNFILDLSFLDRGVYLIKVHGTDITLQKTLVKE